MNLSKAILISMILLLVSLALSVPGIMSYQGKLSDRDDGHGINGTYSMTFRIYASYTGSSPLWSETHPGVYVEKGLFSVDLGTINTIELPFDEQYYLEIVIDGDLMSPRQPLTTEAYAFRSQIADSVVGLNSDWRSDDFVLYTQRNEGLARGAAGNNLFGVNKNTHINFGTNSVTGEIGLNKEHSTVSGGFDNIAAGDGSTVSGGISNMASHNSSVVSGGGGNNAMAEYATVSGGIENSVNAERGTIPGGGYLTVGERSFGFRGGFSEYPLSVYDASPWEETFHIIDAHFNFNPRNEPANFLIHGTDDSVFVIDGATNNISFGGNIIIEGHIIDFFGEEGDSGQIIVNTGDGIMWTDFAGDDDWRLDGDDMYSMPIGNVGIGDDTPEEKLTVDGNIAVTGTVDGYDISDHMEDFDNPHNVTKAQVGLSDVQNINVLNSWSQNDMQYIGTDQIRARDGDGLRLFDDDENGIFIQDGGSAGFGTMSPQAPVEISRGFGNRHLVIGEHGDGSGPYDNAMIDAAYEVTGSFDPMSDMVYGISSETNLNFSMGNPLVSSGINNIVNVTSSLPVECMVVGTRDIVNNIGMSAIDTVIANYSTYSNDIGAIYFAASHFIPTPSNTGSINTNYGIYIDEQSAGSTNWSIYTNGGAHHFGDDVHISGDTYLTAGIHDGTSFGQAGEILKTDGSDIYWDSLWTRTAQFDTIRSFEGNLEDTVYLMANLSVNGELIADSIQAVGDSIAFDDNTVTHGYSHINGTDDGLGRHLIIGEHGDGTGPYELTLIDAGMTLSDSYNPASDIISGTISQLWLDHNPDAPMVTRGHTGQVHVVSDVDVAGYIMGADNYVWNEGMANIAQSFGTRSGVVNYESGSMDHAYVTYSRLTNDGYIQNGYGQYLATPNNSATIDNYYGLYIQDLSGISTTDGLFAIYAEDGKSYFGGNIHIQDKAFSDYTDPADPDSVLITKDYADAISNRVNANLDSIIAHSARIDSTNSAVSDNDDDIVALFDSTLAHSGRIDSTNLAVSDNDDDIAANLDSILAHSARIDSTNIAVSDNDDDIAANLDSIWAHSTRIDSTNNALSDNDDDIAANLDSIRVHSNRIDSTNNAVSDNDDDIAANLDSILAHSARIDSTNGAVSNNDNDIDSIGTLIGDHIVEDNDTSATNEIQDLFYSVYDGSIGYDASSPFDTLQLRGSGSVAVQVDSLTGIITIDGTGVRDLDVQMTTLSEFHYMSLANLHGALDELDQQVFDNAMDIVGNSGDILVLETLLNNHIASDDTSNTNELIKDFSYDHGTHTLAIRDTGATWNVDLSALDESIYFDTLYATRHDTVVVSEDLKVMGELITDSIQAAGDSLFLDDNTYVNGKVYSDTTIATDTSAVLTTKSYVDAMATATSTDIDATIHVAKNGDDATADGSIEKPFLTIAAAITEAAVVQATHTFVMIVIHTGEYNEGIILEDLALERIWIKGEGTVNIEPAAGNAFQSTANNDNLDKLKVENLTFGAPFVIAGSNGTTAFGDVIFDRCNWVAGNGGRFGTIDITCINNFTAKNAYITEKMTFNNLNWSYFESSQIQDSIEFNMDDGANVPNWGAGGAQIMNGVYFSGTPEFNIGGGASFAWVPNGCRIASSDSVTVPTGVSVFAYNSFLLSSWTIDGRLDLRNSQVQGGIDPASTGTINYEQFAGQIDNDSSVPGNTIKDALDSLIAAMRLSRLTDVDTSGIGTGQVLKWDGAEWVPGSDNAGGDAAEFEDSLEAQLIDVADVYTDNDGNLWDDSLYDNSIGELADVDTSGVSLGNVLTWNGTNWVPTMYASLDDTLELAFRDTLYVNEALHIFGELIADSIQAAGDSLFLDDDVYINGKAYATAPTAIGDNDSTLVTKGYVDSRFAEDDLSDNILADISDVDTTGKAAGEVLKWNGTNWIVATDATGGTPASTEAELELQITDATDIYTDNDGELTDDDITDDVIGALANVDTTGNTAGSILEYDGTNWVVGSDDVDDADNDPENELNTAFSWNDGTNQLAISDAGSTMTVSIDNEADDLSDNILADISDVDTTGKAAGEVLKWNGTNWIVATDATGGTPASTEAELELQITDVDDIYTNLDGSLRADSLEDNSIGELYDVDVTSTAPTDGQVLKWDNATGEWIPANDSIGSGGVTTSDMDTIYSTNVDTIVMLENFKVTGEIIVDSIQAAGDVIKIDDNINIHGYISRDANTLYGANSNTHINIGWASITGASGFDYSYATVGGGYNNEASNNDATVGGGNSNAASGNYSSVGGGSENNASAAGASVGGGYRNTASGERSSVIGGHSNEATSDYASVCGGNSNSAQALYSTIIGGNNNTIDAAGTYSTISGGEDNVITGEYSAIPGGYGLTVGSSSFGFRGRLGTGAFDASGESNTFHIVDADFHFNNANNNAANFRIDGTDDNVLFVDASENDVQINGTLDQGMATVASAASVTLPEGNVFTVTGTTGITSIDALPAGTVIHLIFESVLTVTDGGNLKLNNSFSATADDVLTLVSDGTDWYEISRSTN